MRVRHALERPPDDDRPLVLAIGFFDGLHCGHRAIVRALLRLRRPGWRAGVLTFRNHPATYLRPDRVPPLIAAVEERVNLLAQAGIDELFLVPFDAALATLEPRRFLDEVLVRRLRIRALVVGENFRFGAGRSGDATLAREVLGERGIDTLTVPPLLDGDDRVSSTRVRAALARGDFETVNRLLGEPYVLRGRVVLGHGRGHDLGFPTANLEIAPEKALPRDGVYTITARYDGRDHGGLLSIGTNPTFADGRRSIEAWLLDFRRAIYGEELALRDFRFLREQRTFERIEDLIAQMRDDAASVTPLRWGAPMVSG